MSGSYRICGCSIAGTKACERCRNKENKSFAIGNWTMSKYIKLNDITNIIVQNTINNRKTSVADLDDLPTIEIVYCEECKYREKCEQIVVFDIGENQIEGRKIDYCSYGERIEE